MKKCLILALGCSVLLLGGKVEAETKNQTAVDTKLEMKKVIPSNKKSENIDDVLQKMFSQLPEKEISSNKLEVSPRTTRGKTQKDAINWLNDSVGKMYGNGQCVFLAKEYIRWLSGAEVDGHGKEYINKIPSGWKRIYNTADFIPQAGDIMVWDGNQYGHVAVAAEGSTINKYNAYHQNYNADNKGSAVQKWNNQPYNPQGLRFVGVVRPDWTVPKITNGMFVKSPTRHEVYYISEGRRFYVPTWQSVGGQKKVETFSQAEIDRIPNGIANVPDGAFIQEWSDGTVYMLQKGVKIPLSNWKLVGGSHSYTKVPDGTLKNLKQGVENLPDGTLVREWDVNRVYMLQKGVKIYLTDW
ncbi:CHAP domain-containing protein, partial [Pilibacter termitis]